MGELRELIERLEQAEDFDRGLDRDIGLAVGSWRYEQHPEHGRLLYVPEDDCLYADHPGAMYPSFTESLDAAIALCERVLPGWYWRVGRTSLFPNGWAYISRMHPDHCTEKDEASCSDGKAATPAIALALATLRALEAQEIGR